MSSDSSDTKERKRKLRKKVSDVQWTDSETEEQRREAKGVDSEEER